MPQASVISDSPAASLDAASSFVCTWKAAGLDAAWVLLAGELNLATSPLIVDLDPTEPAEELLDLGRRTCEPPYPDSGPGDVADQAGAREDAYRFPRLLTHSPVGRLFGGTCGERPTMTSSPIAPRP